MSVWHGTCTNQGMKLRILMAAVVLTATAPASAGESLAGLVDPTRPHSARAFDAEPSFTGPVLQSTIVTASERRAMINGRFYRVGDQVGAAQVADIQPNRVVLRQAGRETTLSLFPRFTPRMKHEMVTSN